MASQKPTQEGDLNDSWVELQIQQHAGAGTEPTIETPHPSIYNGNLEKLLIEAQRESRTPSHANSKESSARGSPKSPHSPNTEWATGDWRTRQDPGTDWIWDWSSGPEVQPTGDWSEKFRHPAGKSRRLPLSVPKAPANKSGIFRLENLPTLLLTHAATFFLGAAFMFMYLKKYCHWTVAVPSALD
ncbi:BCL2/adenovirus E1B 19 kDa protein-interacting protein 3-like [Littorina saxatilis]|uniref:BCL2/adenovirus E1B 19 kDa protein-interacting protein 3 n=1 Tax=Littorina saxatilis TaxID=31220 RepID=A0AAN9GK46_9CAEN